MKKKYIAPAVISGAGAIFLLIALLPRRAKASMASVKGLSPELEKAIAEVSEELGIPYNWLVTIVGFESGDSFRSDVFNTACSKKCKGETECKKKKCAVGLIQFFPGKHAGQAVVGKTPEELIAMTPEEQMRGPVKLYFETLLKQEAKKGRAPDSIEDWYQLVHGGKLSPVTKGDLAARKAMLAYGKRKGLI